MQKIIIADSNEEFALLLAGAMRSRFLVDIVTDGSLLLEYLRKTRPDVLVLDLMLPGSCGLSVLKTIRHQDLCGSIVITGRFLSDHILDSLRLYSNVAFIARKPCPIDVIAQEVTDLCLGRSEFRVKPADPHCIVSSMLLALNMGTNKRGFTYCRESILLLAEDPSRQVTKEIYPVLAKACNTTSTAVEKAIRASIDKAWEQRNENMWRLYFLPSPDGSIPRPTNTQFLSRLSDALTTERLCVGETPSPRILRNHPGDRER